MSEPPVQPEKSLPAECSDDFGHWQHGAAALWIGLVTLAYFGTIAWERGERIRKIVESILSG